MVTHVEPLPPRLSRASMLSYVKYVIELNQAPDRVLIPIPASGHAKFINAAKGKGQGKGGMQKEVVLFILLVAQEKFGFCPTIDLTKISSSRLRNILKKNLDKILTRPFLVTAPLTLPYAMVLPRIEATVEARTTTRR